MGTQYSYDNIKTILAGGGDFENVPLTGFTLSPSSVSGNVGAEGDFAISFTPANATNRGVSFESSDENVITVDNDGHYVITGAGSAVVTATSPDGSISAKADVFIKDESGNIKVSDIDLSSNSLVGEIGDSGVLTYTITPQTAANQNVTWMCSDSNVLSVEDLGTKGARYTVIGYGEATLTARTVDGGYMDHFRLSVPEVWCTVSFDPNGGSGTNSPEKYLYGLSYGWLPYVARENYTFLGWFTKRDGGTLVTSDTIVSNKNDHVLYAHWKLDEYTVTLDGCGGTIKGYDTCQLPAEYGSTISLSDYTPRLDGYEFVCWMLAGQELASDAVLTVKEDSYLYAAWKEKEQTDDSGSGDSGSGQTDGNGSGNSGSGQTDGRGSGNSGSGQTDGNGSGNSGSGQTDGNGSGNSGSGQTDGNDSGNSGSGQTDGNGSGNSGSGQNEGGADDGLDDNTEDENGSEKTPVKKIVISGAKAVMVGKTITLKAAVTPGNATNSKVKWTSSKTTVATVSSTGKVTAKKAGKVTIKASATDGSGKTCSYTVTVYKKNGNPPASTIVKKASSVKPKALGSKKIKVSWKKQNAGIRYEIQVATDSKFKKNLMTKTASKAKTSLGFKYKKKGTAYVRVRVVDKYGYVGNWSDTKTVKVR
jgi:uncharacterized repeat protein (TIGR02543 family)